MSEDGKVPLPNLEDGGGQADIPMVPEPEGPTTRIAADLEAVFDVPVQVSAVLGRARMEIGDLLKLGPGTVLELDRKVGEAIDIYVNNRLVARGEVVLVEEKLGVTMTEIIKADELEPISKGTRPCASSSLARSMASSPPRPRSRWTRARPSPMPPTTPRPSPCCAPAAAPTC